MTINNSKNRSAHFQDDFAFLFSGDFRSFEKQSFDLVKNVISEHPTLIDYLPHEISDRTAFAVVKKSLDNKKTNQGKIICIKAKSDDLNGWTWTNDDLVDGFSLHKALPNSLLGHTSDPEGAIGMSKDGKLIVSNSASMFLQKIDFDPILVYEKAKIEASSLEMRKCFDRFVTRLGVKACSLSGSTFLVQPSEGPLIDEYIVALRKIGVDSRFVFSLYVKMSENIETYKESLVWQTKTLVEDIQRRLKDATKPRLASLESNADDVKSLLELLKEFNISDDFIQSIVEVNDTLNKQIDAIRTKREAKENNKSSQYLALRSDFKIKIPCIVSLKKNAGRPTSYKVNKATYAIDLKSLECEKADGTYEIKDVSSLASLVFKHFETIDDVVYLNETFINIEDNTYFDQRKAMPTSFVPKEDTIQNENDLEVVDAVVDINNAFNDSLETTDQSAQQVASASYVFEDEAVEETPSAVVEETPIAVVEETPITVVEETPVAVVEETPVAVVEETPVAVVEETPSVVVEETPSVVVASENTKIGLLEYLSSREAQSMNTKRSDLLNKYSESEIEMALNDDSIIEFRGFLYTNG
jgi:hypothetical protein